MPKIPIYNVFALIKNEEPIKSWNNDGIYNKDIDFAQDVTGVDNKEEVIQHLIDNALILWKNKIIMVITSGYI